MTQINCCMIVTGDRNGLTHWCPPGAANRPRVTLIQTQSGLGIPRESEPWAVGITEQEIKDGVAALARVFYEQTGVPKRSANVENVRTRAS